MYIGSAKVNKKYLGSNEIQKAYLGSDLLYEPGNPFTIAMIPDTQKLFIESCITGNTPNDTEIFRQMCAYIRAQKDIRNIKYVTHVGDVVQGQTASYNKAASGRNELIASGIPYAFCPGNWDYSPDGGASSRNLTNFRNFFPLSSVNTQPWFGGNYESSGSENIYYIQTIEGQKWMFLSLEWSPRDAVRTWANNAITTENPDFTVISTHSYIDATTEPYTPGEFWDATLTIATDSNGSNAYGSAFTSDGIDIYNDIVSQQQSVILVLCGHALDGRQNSNDDPVGNNIGNVAHSGRRFTHANGTICNEIIYNHQNDLIPACGGPEQGTAAALHFFEINPTTRRIKATGFDPVFLGDISQLGNYPTQTPDWNARHNLEFNF